ncbi:hypothetical protein QBC35DRAFT_479562, partial [Podospora australis]
RGTLSPRNRRHRLHRIFFCSLSRLTQEGVRTRAHTTAAFAPVPQAPDGCQDSRNHHKSYARTVSAGKEQEEEQNRERLNQEADKTRSRSLFSQNTEIKSLGFLRPMDWVAVRIFCPSPPSPSSSSRASRPISHIADQKSPPGYVWAEGQRPRGIRRARDSSQLHSQKKALSEFKISQASRLSLSLSLSLSLDISRPLNHFRPAESWY